MLSCTLDPAALVRAELAGAAIPGRDPATAVVPTPMQAVHALAFSPDDTRLASAGDDRVVRVWDPATGRNYANSPATPTG